MSESPLSDPLSVASNEVSTPATNLTTSAIVVTGKKRPIDQLEPPKIHKRQAKNKKVTTIVQSEQVVETAISAQESVNTPKKPKQSKAKKVVKNSIKVEDEEEDGSIKAVKVVRKRKTKEEKEAEAMPLAARTLGSKIVLGAHISSAGGVHNAIPNSVHIGGNAFALFLKSQRKWANPPLQDGQCTQFLSSCKEHKYDNSTHKIPPIVPHGSYLVNLAHPDPDRTKQAYDSFLDDLDRCRRLGIKLYNFHPGNAAANNDRPHAIKHLADQLNKAHKDAASGSVITLLETMASGGNVLGSTFEDLASIIEHVEQKERVGVCLDTCHVFAAGYDLRTPEAFKDTMDNFDRVIGLKYLMALHVNDSKAPFGSERDLHANIGTGFLGLRSFHNLVNEPRLWGLPMVLETPIDVKDAAGKEVQDKGIYAREIKLLESLVGMDAESEEFTTLENELQAKGKTERDRVQDQVDRKGKKKEAKATKGKKAGKRKQETSDEESASDVG